MEVQNRKKISLMEAVALLMAISGHPFSSWVLLTQPNLVGGKSIYERFKGVVYKLAKYVIAVGRDYDRAIDIAGEKEGLDLTKWIPEPHRYATHIGGNVLCHNDDFITDHLGKRPKPNARLYAQFILHKNCQTFVEYYDGELNPLTENEIKPHLQKKSESKKQKDFGLTNPIPVINPSLTSIKEFTMAGITYEIVS